ncbi:MAG: ribose-phosphate diphosphokinase, partial [Anaerolineales bacterium]
FIEKRRSGSEDIPEALTLIGDVQGRDVIIVDDEIDTGSSVSQAVNLVKTKGAQDVYLVCVHPILSQNAAERIANLPLVEFITTDTIPLSKQKYRLLKDRITILSVAPLIGEVIRRANQGRSVGEMFDE